MHDANGTTENSQFSERTSLFVMCLILNRSETRGETLMPRGYTKRISQV